MSRVAAVHNCISVSLFMDRRVVPGRTEIDGPRISIDENLLFSAKKKKKPQSILASLTFDLSVFLAFVPVKIE